jgi:hypothetical protein
MSWSSDETDAIVGEHQQHEQRAGLYSFSCGNEGSATASATGSAGDLLLQARASGQAPIAKAIKSTSSGSHNQHVMKDPKPSFSEDCKLESSIPDVNI